MKKFLFNLLFPLFLSAQITSFELVATWSIYDIQDVYTFSSLPDYVGEINYEVEAYKVSYLTSDANGDPIMASGAIFIPLDFTCPAPILSWQHGTVVSDSGAPSENIENSAIGIVSASHGYIVFMSDYLGLGSGEGFHNYCHAQTEASAVIDLIIEGNIFVESLGFETNGQLFLMGYSQGGHATMATVKAIESNDINLEITASAPMAGPYSMSEAQASMLNTVYPNPGYFPYVLFAYQNVYGNLYDNIGDVLKPEFDNLFEMYDGTYSMSEINEEIWSIADNIYDIDSENFTPLDMIVDDYYADYQSDESHPFRLALQENDLIDFIPESPMRLLHCNGDADVSYENAVMAYNAFAPFATEELVLLDGGNLNHSDCALVSIISAKLFFDTYANLCNPTFLNELNSNQYLVNIFDIFGRPVIKQEPNTLFFKVHSNGFVDKVILNY